MPNDDDFLYQYRKGPPTEAIEGLWQKLSAQEQRRPARRSFRVRMAAAGLALTLALVLFVPPVRVMAQEALQLFVQTAQNRFSINFSFDDSHDPHIGFDGIEQPRDMDVDVAIGRTPDNNVASTYPTLEEAQAQTTTPIHAPTQVPEGYNLISAIVRENSPLITLHYGKDAVPSVTLHQRAASTEPPTTHFATHIQVGETLTDTQTAHIHIDIAFGEIGPDVVAEYVQIGTFQGELVRGVWEIDADALKDQEVASGTTISIEPVWNTDGSGMMLRWQNDTTLFEIISTDDLLDATDLIAIANSIE
ncbi:MAG: hypothetical protein AAGF95_06765 [Chloroflexota bacterium]